MATSWNAWLSTFKVGERRYTETTPERYATDMSTRAAPPSRRPASIQGWRFESTLLTAIAVSRVGDVRYLICVERTA